MAKGCTVNLEDTYTNINVVGSAVVSWLSGLTTQVGTGEIGAGELATDAVTAIKQAFVGAGSPPSGGYNVQAGENVLSSGSRWVAFPKAYVAAPRIVAGAHEEAIDSNFFGVSAGSIDTGSFMAVGSGTSTGSFTWFAVGSGNW